MNRHRHSRCHYKRNSGSAPRGYEQPPYQGARGTTNSKRLTAARSDSCNNGFRASAAVEEFSPTEDENQPFRPGGGDAHLSTNTAPAGAGRPKARRQVLASALAEAAPEHEHRPRGMRCAGQPSGAVVGARKTWTRHNHRSDRGRNAAPWLGSSSSPSPAWLKEASAGLERAFLPQTTGGEKGSRPPRRRPPARCAPPPQPG
jgi:hypothetical protein